ncbi:DUF7521 family protein [Halococcus sp. AFM35]|uniref:DUF7521 family protein n=1 Tax=Halococcus sp. AFM35 TaxID=3421653 RepID=UPI003EBF2E98
MANSPEFVGFVALSVVVLLAGGALTTIGLLAYWRKRTRSLLAAVVGFALITSGVLVESIYEIGIKRPFFLTGIEILRLQLIELTFVIVGIGTLLYSLVRY